MGFRSRVASRRRGDKIRQLYASFLVVRDVEFGRGVVRRLRLVSANRTWVVLSKSRSLVEIENLVGARAPKFRLADRQTYSHSPVTLVNESKHFLWSVLELFP